MWEFFRYRRKNILGSKDIDNPKLVSNPLHLVKQLCTSKNVIVRGKSFPRKFLKTCACGFLFSSHSTLSCLLYDPFKLPTCWDIHPKENKRPVQIADPMEICLKIYLVA